MPDIATLEENVSESEESEDEPIRYFVVHNTTHARGKWYHCTEDILIAVYQVALVTLNRNRELTLSRNC